MEEIRQRVIKQVQRGKRKAYRQVINVYQQNVFHICFIITDDTHRAETLAKETFVHAYLNIYRYDFNQKFSTWLYHMAMSLSKNQWKEAIKNKQENTIWTLPILEKVALTLRNKGQLSLSEISYILEVPVVEVKTCIRNARESLCRQSMSKMR